jgi:hypothetical protein
MKMKRGLVKENPFCSALPHKIALHSGVSRQARNILNAPDPQFLRRVD